MAEPVLSVRRAYVQYQSSTGPFFGVDDVSMDVMPGEAVAVVGESGCGKTTLARAILGLQPLHSGEIILSGTKVSEPKPGQASRVGVVWQDPYASMNPRHSIARIVAEPFELCGKTLDLAKVLTEVGLDESYGSRYPHQLSGGQRQRVAIARAIGLRPPLIICDEPTAALDLSIQAQILNLLKDLRDTTNASFLYISHDLLTVQYWADKVAVMYMGQVVEFGTTAEIFENPKHPYTKALLDSAPSLENLGHLPAVAPGEIPDPATVGTGCKFRSRCTQARPDCAGTAIEFVSISDRLVKCKYPLSGSNESSGG